MGISKTIKDLILPEEEYLEMDKSEAKELNLSDGDIILFEPRNFDEIESVAIHLKHEKACCINLGKMPEDYRQRAIDFLSGVVCGINGTIKKIDTNIILCSSRSLKVDTMEYKKENKKKNSEVNNG